MTAPVTSAVPAARAASTASSDGGATQSAAPFASALDGALADGRGAIRDTGAGGGQHSSGGSATGGETEAPADGAVPVVDTAVAGVAAALWALALGATAVPAPGSPGLSGPGTAALPGALPVGVVAADAGPPAPVPAAAAGDGPFPAAPVLTGAARVAGATVGSVPAGGLPGTAGAAVGSLTVVAPATAGAGGVEEPAGTGPVGRPAESGPSAGGAAPVLPVGATAPGSGGPGDGEPGQGSPALAVPGTETTAEPASEPAAPVTSPAGGAPAGLSTTSAVGGAVDTDAATGTGASLPVSGQVARQVAVLSGAGDGSHTMTLVLTPENLGPVEVKVTVSGSSLDLTLRGASELGRAALMDALPELRRDLESAGLNPSRVEVDADADSSWLARHAAEQQAQQGSGDRASARDRAGERFPSGDRTADSGEGRANQPRTRSTSSGVDVLA